MSSVLPHTISVVGCSGFIGSHLTHRLLNEGVCVRGLDLECARIQASRNHPGFEFRQGDYTDPDNLEWVTQGVDAVVHLAALCNPSLYNTQSLRVIQSNYWAPMAMVEACARNGTWLVHFSTSEVYGRTLAGEFQQQARMSSQAPEAGTSVLSPELTAALEGDYTLGEDRSPLLLGPTLATRWCYASAKQLLERTIVAWDQESPFPWTMVRPFNFIGPGMDYIPGMDGEGIPRVVACFLGALLKDEPLSLVDGGQSRRCFTWIGDAVDAVVRILQCPATAQGQIFNIGNPDNEVTMRELAGRMGSVFHRLNGAPKRPVAMRSVSAQEFYGCGYEDSDRRMPDITKARTLLDWAPRTDLNSALEQTVAWFREHYAVQLATVNGEG